MRKLPMRMALAGLGCSLLVLVSFAQSPLSGDSLIRSQLPQRAAGYVDKVSATADKTTAALEKQTARYLAKLQKEELRLAKLLSKKDSLAATRLYNDAAKKYAQLSSDIKNKADRLRRPVGKYFPFTDTATIGLQLLGTANLAGKLPVNPAALSGAVRKVKELKDQLNQAENIKDFIRLRKQVLTGTFQQYQLAGELKKYNATAYYYGQQVRDVEAVFDDPSKAEQNALSLLREYGPFKELMEKNGMLAGLFNVPGNYAETSVAGLQTLSQVQQLLTSQISSMGPNSMETVKNSIATAQSELAKVRNQLKGGGEAADLPGFKPDQVKTKSFKDRLVYGLDVSTTRGNLFMPNYTDIALTIGVKLTDRFTIGAGAAYKLGFGKDWQHIRLTSEGAGLRTYLDYRVKKGLFVSGGMELNYLSAFNSIKELRDYNAWKKSGLIGISKTVALKSRFLKNTRVSLLYDILHATQTPASKALVIRCGYNF